MNKKVNTIRNFFSNVAFVLLSILGSLVVGFMFGAIGTFVYLVIVFPIIIGFSGGYIITETAKYMKTRNKSWTNNATERAIGRIKIRARTVRGYKSWNGMQAGLMLAATHIC